MPDPLLLPPDRKLVYPRIGWEWLEDDYREMTELNDMGRTEDISLGLNVFASVGFAEPSAMLDGIVVAVRRSCDASSYFWWAGKRETRWSTRAARHSTDRIKAA